MRAIQNRAMKKKDDAVSNVVVMMLLLSIVVIAFAVIVGTYLPQLKETAEMQHSTDVKEAFLQFSGDIDSVYTRSQPGVYSQLFTLGGGDVMFSSSKSSGTARIGIEPLNASYVDTFSIDYKNRATINYDKSEVFIPGAGTATSALQTVNLSYEPVLAYWEDQGYNYSRGVVWVSKNGAYTPVADKLYAADDGYRYQQETTNRWIASMTPQLIGTTPVPVYNTTNPDLVDGFKTDMVYAMTVLNFSIDPVHASVSGSGDVKLKIVPAWKSETKYELNGASSVQRCGETVPLQAGTNATFLQVTELDVRVMFE